MAVITAAKSFEQGGGIGLELGDLFSCATCSRGHARIGDKPRPYYPQSFAAARNVFSARPAAEAGTA